MCTWILYQKTSNFRTTINLGIYQQCCRCLHFLHQILYLLPPSPHLPEHDLSNSVPYINICIYINEIMHLAEQVARPFRTETIFSVLITCLDHFYNLKVMTVLNTALHVLLQFIIDHSLEIIFLFFTMHTSSLSWFFKLFSKKVLTFELSGWLPALLLPLLHWIFSAPIHWFALPAAYTSVDMHIWWPIAECGVQTSSRIPQKPEIHGQI